MKILHISPRYRGGGAERSAREMFHAQRDRGHHVSMLTAVPEEETPSGVICVRSLAERLWFPINYLDPIAEWRHRGTRRRLDAIQPTDFDVVHLHNLHGHWISLKAVHRLCQRIPTVWTLRDGWAAYGGVAHDLSLVLSDIELKRLTRFQNRLMPLSTKTSAAKAWRTFLSQWMPQPARALCPSDWVRREAIRGGFFRDVPFEVLPNGVGITMSKHLKMSRDVARTEWGIEPEAKVLLLIAASLETPYKGMHLGLEAIRRLVERHSSGLTVMLLGRHTQRFRGLMPAKVKSVCSFAQTDAQLISAYRAADITLVPSIAEQFGLVAAESLACETPIVCFDVGGLAEIVGDDERGRRIPKFDVAAMATALQELLSNRLENNRLGVAGKSWVMTNCRYDLHVDRTLDAYRSAISNHSS